MHGHTRGADSARIGAWFCVGAGVPVLSSFVTVVVVCQLLPCPSNDTKIRKYQVLKAALAHVKQRWVEAQDYKWACEQLKARSHPLTHPHTPHLAPSTNKQRNQHPEANTHNQYPYPLFLSAQSIRQDLTVQHSRGPLAVETYETHARIALEARAVLCRFVWM